MKRRMGVFAVLAVLWVPAAKAQVAERTAAYRAECSEEHDANLISTFPSVDALLGTAGFTPDEKPNRAAAKEAGIPYEGKYAILRKADPGQTNRIGSGAMEVGWGPGVWRGLLLDNITLQASAAYSKTLSSTVTNGVESSPLQLSGVQFVPSYSLTYSVPLSKILPALRAVHAEKYYKEAKVLRDQDDATKVTQAYADFEQARESYLGAAYAYKALTKPGPQARNVSTGAGADPKPDDPKAKELALRKEFYGLKSKAVSLLALAGSSEQMSDWVHACYAPSEKDTQTAENRQ